METKTVYMYDLQGFYSGPVTLDDSDKSPSGQWLIPGRATEMAPLDQKEHYLVHWSGSAWEYVEDKHNPVPKPEPEKTLDELKAEKLADFKAQRDAEEIEPIEHNGYSFDFDANARERITYAMKYMERNGVSVQQWTTADNQEVNVTAEDLHAIEDKAAERSGALHVKYRELRTTVNAAKNKGELDAISW